MDAKRCLSCTVLGISGVVLLPSLGTAANYQWNNSSGGNFFDSANWTPSGVPGSADKAYFNLGKGTYAVNGGTTSIAELRVLGSASAVDDVTLNLASGNTLTVTGGTGGGTAVGTELGVVGSTGMLTLSGGGTLDVTAVAPGLIIGSQRTGFMTVDGSSVNARGPYVGSGTGGDGTLNLLNGSTLYAASGVLAVGRTGATGKLVLDSNSTATAAAAALSVGEGGTGLVEVRGGSTLSASYGHIGKGGTASSPLSSVTIVGSDATHMSRYNDSGQFSIGGKANVEGGPGLFEVDSFGEATLAIGAQVYSRGTIKLDGGTVKVNGTRSLAVNGKLTGTGNIQRNDASGLLGIVNGHTTITGAPNLDMRGGIVSPGTDTTVGKLAVSFGYYNQNDGGQLLVNLGGTGAGQYDQIDLTAGDGTITNTSATFGSAIYDGGTVKVSFVDGFTGHLNDTFDLVIAKTVTLTQVPTLDFGGLSGYAGNLSVGTIGSAHSLRLTLTEVIPEPTTGAIAGMLLCSALLPRRRRR